MIVSIRYEVNPQSRLNADQVLSLFEKAGISKPNWTAERMTRALNGCSIVVCAWDRDRLVGFGNAITDFAWVGHISQLAVDPHYQNQGIGKALVGLIKDCAGDEVTLLVHAREEAKRFYEAAGFEVYSNVYRSARRR